MWSGRIWSLGIVLVLIASFFLATSNARAEQGGADGFGYRWTDSDSPEPTVTFDWIDITGTGILIPLSGDDEYLGPYPVGFDFSYYDSTYLSFYVGTNGLMGFNEVSLWEYMNTPLPYPLFPNNIIAPYWSDLCVDYGGWNTGAVYYELLGTSPNQQLVVEWFEISELGSYNEITFEAIMNETGEIRFQYLALSGMTGEWATVGIEDYAGSDGSQYSFLQPVLHNSLAIEFSIASLGFGPDQSQMGANGSTVVYNLFVSNNEAVADSFDITNFSNLGWPYHLYDAGMVPLGDTNGNGIPDTGDLLPWERISIIATVDIPVSPVGDQEITVLTATSFSDPTLSDDATLYTALAPAAFDPPHSDLGMDTDSDGLYNWLVVTINLTVDVEGDYAIDAMLYDSSMYPIDYWYSWIYCYPGTASIDAMFEGYTIRAVGVDGPYNVVLGLYLNNTQLDSDVHVTAAYTADQFETPPAYFVPPYEDDGYDSDGNGLYDYLLLNVTVEVEVEGFYFIRAELLDSNGTYLTFWETASSMVVGTYQYAMMLNGLPIYRNGVDGPYLYTLTMYDVSNWTLVDYDENLTGPYTYDQFEPSPVNFEPPYYDYGYDDEDDGYYDFLIMDVTVNCTEPGWYYIAADLLDPMNNRITYWANDVYLGITGLNLVEVWWEGRTIFNYGVDGPYIVNLVIYDENVNMLYDWDSTTTSSYTYDQFQPAAAWLSPPHSDYGIDEDSDGLYDYLAVNVSVHVVTPGNFSLYAELIDPYWNSIGWEFVMVHLEAGNRSIEVRFDGFSIFANGVSGQFTVQLWLYDEWWSQLDSGYHVTDSYGFDEFTDIPGRIFSAYADTAPTIDGVYSPSEWANATSIDLREAVQNNMIDSLLLVMNNETHLFICYDATGDMSASPEDISSIGFDTGNDEIATDGHEDQFIIGPFIAYGETHYVYESSLGDWDEHCTPFSHPGLSAAFGFGKSDASTTNHRIYEYAIPLAMIGAEPGDVLGFEGLSAIGPGVGDSATWNYSSWPLNEFGLPLEYFGDLHLAFGLAKTSAALSGTLGLNDWYVSPVTVALTATGGNKGINYTMYQVDGGGWEEYSGPISVTSDGSHMVEFYSVDKVGNEEEPKNVSFKIDTAAPVSSASVSGTSGSNGWYVSAVDISIAADDGLGSGLSSLQVNVDGTGWQEYSGPVALSTPGSHTIEYYSDDLAGNEESVKSVAVNLDLAAPSSECDLFGTIGSDDWYSEAVVFTLSATDATPGSGVDVIRYRLNGSSWTDYSGPVTVGASGSYTLDYYSVDTAGNAESSKRAAFKIDLSPPITGLSYSGGYGYHGWYKSEVAISLTPEDPNGSGVASTMYRIGIGLWQTYSAPVVLSTDGESTFSFYSVDVVGNEEAVRTETIKIDQAVPMTIAIVEGTTIALSGSDATSGLWYTMYRIDGEAWQTYTGLFNVTGKGNHSIEYYSVDNANNSEPIKTVWVEIGGGGALGGGAALALVVAAIVIVVAAVLYFLMWRKKKPEGAGPAEPPVQ